ncbi:phage portal protein [Sphingomonas hengshuiensis]|uniref:phage portal protein n=1 Tax=Sphingomonas hengshuiensis TaxID=1609977 RepID=UPI0005CA3F29|nr:phage portal protein [Sphingomonas hengshuiensis]
MAGIFGSIGARLERKSALEFLPGFLIGQESKSGVAVTWSTALQVTAMFACARVVAEGIAQCGFKLRRPKKNGRGSEAATDHPLYRILHRRPNSWQTAFEFWEMLVFHLMLVGNAFVYISWSGDGRVLELIPLEPRRVTVKQGTDLSLTYEVTGSDDRVRRIQARDIWHLRGPSWNGWMGMETVKLAQEALGLAIALEESHARQHRDGLKIPGMYSIDGPLNEDQHKLMTKWLKNHAAAGNADPLVLDRGAKWFTQRMTGADAQHIETRRFQVEEICRAARVMPIMLGVPGAAGAYDNGETMFIAHTMHTLAPWGGRMEQSAEVNLLSERDQAQGLEVKVNLAAMMRGDFKSRQEGLQIMRRNGVINANGWLSLEDMDPREDEGGEQFIVEGNMAVQDGRDLVPIKTVIA